MEEAEPIEDLHEDESLDTEPGLLDRDEHEGSLDSYKNSGTEKRIVEERSAQLAHEDNETAGKLLEKIILGKEPKIEASFNSLKAAENIFGQGWKNIDSDSEVGADKISIDLASKEMTIEYADGRSVNMSLELKNSRGEEAYKEHIRDNEKLLSGKIVVEVTHQVEIKTDLEKSAQNYQKEKDTVYGTVKSADSHGILSFQNYELARTSIYTEEHDDVPEPSAAPLSSSTSSSEESSSINISGNQNQGSPISEVVIQLDLEFANAEEDFAPEPFAQDSFLKSSTEPRARINKTSTLKNTDSAKGHETTNRTIELHELDSDNVAQLVPSGSHANSTASSGPRLTEIEALNIEDGHADGQGQEYGTTQALERSGVITEFFGISIEVAAADSNANTVVVKNEAEAEDGNELADPNETVPTITTTETQIQIAHEVTAATDQPNLTEKENRGIELSVEGISFDLDAAMSFEIAGVVVDSEQKQDQATPIEASIEGSGAYVDTMMQDYGISIAETGAHGIVTPSSETAEKAMANTKVFIETNSFATTHGKGTETLSDTFGIKIAEAAHAKVQSHEKLSQKLIIEQRVPLMAIEQITSAKNSEESTFTGIQLAAEPQQQQIIETLSTTPTIINDRNINQEQRATVSEEINTATELTAEIPAISVQVERSAASTRTTEQLTPQNNNSNTIGNVTRNSERIKQPAPVREPERTPISTLSSPSRTERVSARIPLPRRNRTEISLELSRSRQTRRASILIPTNEQIRVSALDPLTERQSFDSEKNNRGTATITSESIQPGMATRDVFTRTTVIPTQADDTQSQEQPDNEKVEYALAA